jgi:hypothetical protein
MKTRFLTILLLLALLVLPACASTTGPTCVDYGTLARCELPASLPEHDGEAVKVLWEALLVCHAVTSTMLKGNGRGF